MLVLLAASLAFATGCSDPGAPPPTVAPRASNIACGTGDPGLATEGRHRITVQGTERSYLLMLPDALDPAGSAPLVVALHGFGSSAEEFEDRTGLGAAGAARGAVVAVPDATGPPSRWNFDRRADGPDDFAFLDVLITQLTERLCLDPERIAVAGSSNGAAFAGLYACSDDHTVVAVAMVIATVPPACPDTVTPAVLTVRGTADTHVPFPGTAEVVAAIASHHGCGASPTFEAPTADVARTRYTGCRDDREVVLDAVVGGTHSWPGGRGATPAGYDATLEVLDFFDRHAHGVDR